LTCGSTQSDGCNKKPRQFSQRGEVGRYREQRELRTAARVLILRQRSASAKIPPKSVAHPDEGASGKKRSLVGGEDTPASSGFAARG